MSKLSKLSEMRELVVDDPSYVHARYNEDMSDSGRAYRHIDFPPLTEAQKKELEGLVKMKEEDSNTEDIPEVDFSDAVLRYDGTKGKT